MLSYETAISVLQTPEIFVWVIITYLFPLLLYFLVGIFSKARNADGSLSSSSMISSTNFWYAIIIWGLLGIILFLGLLFPVWLRIF